MSDQAAEEAAVDLAAYFARIGYGGPAEPTLEVLAAVLRSHAATVPFEAIDVFLHRNIDMTANAVDAKLIGRRRGGYCYEQNSLFRRVLLTLGYEVTNLIGRGMWGEIRPRAHWALKVRAEGEDWLVDVGNSASTPTAPLQWRYDVAQETPHGDFRLVADGADTVLEEAKPAGWEGSYSLSPDAQLEWDFYPANWWTSTHPSSYFRNNLICTLAPADVRIILFNNRLTVRRVGSADEEQRLDADSLERCLTSVFGMQVETIWRPHLQRAVELGEGAGG
jgi:N-hydroxyarylamine O-acetyltransferase